MNKQFGISINEAKSIVHGYQISLKNLIEASEDVLELFNTTNSNELEKLRIMVEHAKLAFKR